MRENNWTNDGDFDWIQRLQEHRVNRSKTTANTSTISNQFAASASKDALSKTFVTTFAGGSSLTTGTRQINESRHRSTTQRSNVQYPLPLSSTNGTTMTLNGGSKTTLSMASTSKIPTAILPTRPPVENQRSGPPPTKRRGLVPPLSSSAAPSLPPSLATLPSTYSYHHTHQPATSVHVNNSNASYLGKEGPSSLFGQNSEPTCCFFKRKAKRALQITSTTSRKT